MSDLMFALSAGFLAIMALALLARHLDRPRRDPGSDPTGTH